MLNDEPGKYFRKQSATRLMKRGETIDGSTCILIVDPILGSRFSLAQAVAHPGHVVKAASTIDEALSHLERGNVALIIVDQQLSECDGIDFLVEVRVRYPTTQRALVTASDGISFIRGAIERAGLCFLLSKPWSPSSLRKTIREVLGGETKFKGWNRAFPDDVSSFSDRSRNVYQTEPYRRHEILLRGLLAGLNSCEFEGEVFELLHTELANPCRVSEWLWVDEGRGLATRIVGDWPVEGGVPIDALTEGATQLLTKARRSLRVTRLDDEPTRVPADPVQRACVGLAIRDEGRRTRTCLIWADRRHLAELVSMMRELQTGLQMVFRRIRLANARAEAARRLAQHVSDELRRPVGALTHAIDRLRGEAERAGMPTEWVDRVSSESERVARAVKQIEGEMRTDALRLPGSAS